MNFYFTELKCTLYINLCSSGTLYMSGACCYSFGGGMACTVCIINPRHACAARVGLCVCAHAWHGVIDTRMRNLQEQNCRRAHFTIRVEDYACVRNLFSLLTLSVKACRVLFHPQNDMYSASSSILAASSW